MSLHEFYHLKALITLEQVDTAEWSIKIRILISKTTMVGYCKLSLYTDGLVMNLLFFRIEKSTSGGVDPRQDKTRHLLS